MSYRLQMKHAVLLPALLLTAACAGGMAGSATSEMSDTAMAPEAVASFAGQWAGTFSASVGDGEIYLMLEENEGTWSGGVTMSVGGQVIDAALESITTEENRIRFLAYIEGADVEYRATLSEGTLTGTIVAWAEGQEVGSGTFTLTRR